MSNPELRAVTREMVPNRWTPDECARQGYIDLQEEWLWVGRDSFRETLKEQLGWWAHKKLTAKGHYGMWKIIEFDNNLRLKRTKREQEEKAAKPPVVPPVEAPAPPPVAHLDVHISTLEAARALGLTVPQFKRLSKSPGFPPQIDRDTLPLARGRRVPRQRCTDVYSARAVEAYYIANRDVIVRLQEEMIARLQAQLDTRKAAKTAS